jgi:hypothetical protein
MSDKEPKPVCPRCGKQLQNVPCEACDGKGEFSEWLVVKRECRFCMGSGQVLRCPDELKHIQDDFKVAKELDTKSLFQSFRKGNPFTPKPPKVGEDIKKPSTQKIPPPWDRKYPDPWHPNHPLNPQNPYNPNNPRSPFRQGLKPNFPQNPFNWNNPSQARRNANWGPKGRLPGGPTTNAPPPEGGKKK